MESQVFGGKTQISHEILKSLPLDDCQMTSSILSVTSSLTSPVDSGVQLLDSESDITSVMSMSGTACDLDSNSDILNTLVTNTPVSETYSTFKEIKSNKDFLLPPAPTNIMTKSDIANQNTTLPCDYSVYSSSAPNVDLEINFKNSKQTNSKNNADTNKDEKIKETLDTAKVRGPEIKEALVSDEPVSKIDSELKSFDIKEDIIDINPENVMHVSVSEEANELSKLDPQIDAETEAKTISGSDEQIVFRRQRKKKSSKSDTPKKRVSFHEDILNSTKIDDIHINHGFITHQPDISMSFFNWDSIRKKDVVKGRYSWAAEGDTPYYQRNIPEREAKSEIYMNSRYSSTSSSSVGSVDSSSSNSLCDNEQSSDGIIPTLQKVPKSSCLKKRPAIRHIDTRIVQEDIIQRKSESNLLDSNIFGSLKNILNFSTSVPLAERGVPEGQEDVDSSCKKENSCENKRKSFGNSEILMAKSLDRNEKFPDIPKKLGNLNIEVSKIGNFVEVSKTNMKLAPSEGFYPTYSTVNLPANVVLCDSNVFEHKGISYSYEYDKFQKSFETVKTQKPKSSTVYQMLLQDLNFFKKKEKEKSENDLKSLAEPQLTSTPNSEKVPSRSKRASIADWSSDTETVSDFSENISSKHLSSPKHKVKPNHYSIQNFKHLDSESKNDLDSQNSSKFQTLKPATSKTSLINRFLRNVTMKKLMDAKLQKKSTNKNNKYMGLYLKGVKPDTELCQNLDKELEEEVKQGLKIKQNVEEKVGSSVLLKLKKEVFRDSNEKLLNLYKVHSGYTSTGDSKPLIVVLTSATLYITGFKPNQTFSNQFVLPYTELYTIMVGPNSHIIHFSNADREMQFLISTGSSDVTNALIAEMEMATRKALKGPQGFAPLPAVKHLTMREMVQLRHAVCKQTAVDKDEEYFHYSIVNVQDVNCEPAATPLGPIKEGPLMFKTSNDIRWETGYFILKGGVLYMLSSPSNRLPLRVLPLGAGACLGAHRTPYCLRPHTFELLLGSMILQLAAPDEYVASEWLQVLVQTASGLYGSHEVNHTQSCTLLLTSQHILTMRESFPSGNIQGESQAQTLSCAAIADLTAFRIPLAEQSWCILEFACREVHETSGDLVIYFATNAELERFISTLEMLWAYNNLKGDLFPLSTISDTESINKKCAESYRILQGSWPLVSLSVQ